MNGETFVLLENFCRTCMNGDKEDDKVNEGKKSISIFNKTETVECKNITIMELLLLTTPQLNIDSGDMLPKILCESCLQSLISAYNFQKMCIRVEQKLREMIKVEYPAESETKDKDPLKDSLVDVVIENVAVSQAISDLSNILKIEMDEPLIDQNVSGACNKNVADDSNDVKLETDDNRWQENSESDEHDDSDSEWETVSHKSKRKKGPKAVVKKVKKAIVTSNDHKDEPKTDVTYESKINSNLTDDIKQGESNKFSCEECGNLLKTRKSLMRHKRIHLRHVDVKEDEEMAGSIEEAKIDAEIPSSIKDVENKKFVCDECGNCLATRKSLKRHKRIHLRPVEEGHKNSLVKTKYECEFCKKVFQQSSSLKDHLRTHTGEQPYLCSECGKAFKSLSNMKQHFLRHGTDRPYICPDCPKRFPCLSDLASHKAVHNKTKSHVCDICGAAFVKPYLLKKHKMYHTGERNHKCDYCEMRFVLADQCRRHMRTHTGEKPYKCKYCERAFAQSNDLIKHLRGHLGDNVYKCDLCPQGFRLQMDLRAHFNTHKNDDEETKVRNLEALKNEEHRLQIKFGLVNCS